MIVAMPFAGHIAPFLPVIDELVARGHEVELYSGSAFREAVERHGAMSAAWTEAPDFDENDLAATFPRLQGRKGIAQLLINVEDLFVRTGPAQVADLQAIWNARPWDVLLADGLSVGASLIAELTPAPWVSLSVTPLNMPSRDMPPSGMGIVPGRTPIGRARDALLRSVVPLMDGRLTRALNEARTAVGLTPTEDRFGAALLSKTRVLALGSPGTDFPRSDMPGHVRWIGRVVTSSLGRPFDRPGWWQELETPDRLVVLVTQGTQNVDASDLIRPAIDALALDTNVLVVVTTGQRQLTTLPFPIPPNVRVADFLPFEELLPHVDVMITNGGWGGTLAGLAHGVPLIIAGGDLDKPEIAARIAYRGAGVDLRTGRPTAKNVAEAFQRMRSDGSFRVAAGAIGDELAQLGGAATIADEVESAARRAVP
ncbi:glycosyltransferase [Naasia lichenicola]|uniref:Erythromycin biosynthesis protein CIII-like C-terminal domain-containing protein n=1 Tax=Naasia lichenicola TaxID=2565933 RepID=A0A4S4FR23_9MICO|nr:nucleotide disphospho-sugar-binding domain-containing protein [Naasia lichenicola]THG33050.1 hypothetical protein E6C64_01420 [Naasia lichenicola]